MIAIRIWSGSGQQKPSSSYLERVRDLKMPETKAYRMNDGSLLLSLPYKDEQVKEFEDLLKNEKFGRVPLGQAGSLKSAHYAKFDSAGVR